MKVFLAPTASAQIFFALIQVALLACCAAGMVSAIRVHLRKAAIATNRPTWERFAVWKCFNTVPDIISYYELFTGFCPELKTLHLEINLENMSKHFS